MSLRKMLMVAGLALAVFILPYACKTVKHETKKPELDCSTIQASYSKDIVPIINYSCMPCHRAGSMKGDFTIYEGVKAAVTSGELEKHVLILQDMPPKGPLSEQERKQIRCWLNSGAPNN